MPQTRPGSAARLNSIKPRQLLGQAGRDHLSALQSDLADEGAFLQTHMGDTERLQEELLDAERQVIAEGSIGKARVLCYCELSSAAPRALEQLRGSASVVLDYRAARDGEARADLLEAAEHADALWVPPTVLVDEELMRRAPRLKVICSATVGTDHIDVEAAQERGIAVLSLRDDDELLRSFSATGELAWLLTLAVCRHLRPAAASVQEGNWQGEMFRGMQLSGKTIGIVGVGRLGTAACKLAKALGMKVIATDAQPLSLHRVQQVTLEELVAAADVVQIHVELTADTRSMFDTRIFGLMKRGAVLVNTSSGAVIDEDALIRALRSGQLAGFGCDVVCDEWRHESSQLLQYSKQYDNVVITPHIGDSTGYTAYEARTFMARKVMHWLQTGEVLEMREGPSSLAAELRALQDQQLDENTLDILGGLSGVQALERLAEQASELQNELHEEKLARVTAQKRALALEAEMEAMREEAELVRKSRQASSSAAAEMERGLREEITRYREALQDAVDGRISSERSMKDNTAFAVMEFQELQMQLMSAARHAEMSASQLGVRLAGMREDEPGRASPVGTRSPLRPSARPASAVLARKTSSQGTHLRPSSAR